MEDLRNELRRLGFKGSSVTRNTVEEPVPEIITDPARVAKLTMIAQAYSKGDLTMMQAAALVAKV